MKRLLSLVLVVAMSVAIIPANNLFAASSNAKYVKSFKLFTKKGAEQSDAQKWCDEQNKKVKEEEGKWYVAKGDLNAGADGAFQSAKGVFLCYQTTNDSSEAVTDLAVMNERGNYSESEYKRILEKQNQMYVDMVSTMKTMLEEYRTNFKNNVTTAVDVNKTLNKYIEDDSKKRLGDFLLDCTDENLATVLMQANGDVVLFIEEQLQLACDTGKSTWLDRMEQLGSYKALRDKALKAYNGDGSKADKALKVKYYDDAKLIYDSWDDMQSHIKHTHNFVEKNGLDKMSEEQSKAWIEEHASEQDTQQYLYEIQVIDSLIGYKYEDNTLLDFMAKDKKEFEGENIKYLYPLVSCLSKGQKAGLDSFTGMFAMTKNAMAATVLNDYKTGKAKELADLDKDDKKFLEDSLEVYEEVCDNANESTPVSVYTGVDRELFKDGVAVTTTAQTFSNGSNTNWTDAFVESDKLLITSATMGALSIASLSLSVVGACVIRSTTSAMRVSEFNSLISATSIGQVQNKGLVFIEDTAQLTEMQTVFEQLGANQFLKSKDLYTDVINASKEAMITPTGIKLEERAVEIRNVVNKNAATAAQKAHPFYNAMKIGFAVAAIILCAVDIALTVYTLYKYYNREHLDIPKYMVDISYDEDKETSYINYKMLKTQDGDDGDLNAGIGKQWLAIYQTKDEDFGNPIIVSDDKPIVVQYGKSKAPEGYSPLHLFGVLSSAQNLTFEDGENGWSYNDKKGGTYLFFNRSDFPKSGNQEGTVIDYAANKTTFGIVTALIGLVIGAGGMLIVSKKKKRNE